MILRRVEVRDLYSCLWKVRVPKMYHEIRDHQHNGRLWKAMNALKVQPQGESIHLLLDEVTKNRITVEDLWVEVCTLSTKICMMTDYCNYLYIYNMHNSLK